MLRNYFFITLRNLKKNKLFSFINIFGLSLSLAVCMVIIMVVAGQMAQDRHVIDHERIYRINTQWVKDGKRSSLFATTTLPVGSALVNEYSGVDESVRIRRGFGNGWVTLERDLNIPVAGFYVDHNFLNFFNYDLKFGNPHTALNDPYSVVLTESTAMKLFDRTDVIGEVIQVGDLGEYTVTGIIREPLPKSHMVFEALASMSTIPQLESQHVLNGELENWKNYTPGWVYVKLSPETSPEQIEPVLNELAAKHTTDEKNGHAEYSLQPLTGINPGPLTANAIGPIMPMVVVYFLGGLCLIIMVTAGFNYTNLSIAKALTRTKEVGVRKVSGAMKSQIFTQFIMESVLISFIAYILGMVLLVIFFKPAFEGLTFSSVLQWDVAVQFGGLLFSLLFTLVVGVLVGLLPSSILSSFNPTQALKGQSGKVMSKVGLRKFLLGSQFAMSLVFIITMVLVNRQFNLLTTSDYGFNNENIWTLPVEPEESERLKAKLLSYSSIENVSAASHILSSGRTYRETLRKNLGDEGSSLDYFIVDEDYLENLDIDLVAGRNFPSTLSGDEERFILINEKAVSFYEFNSAQEAINQSLYLNDSTEVKILGVVQNYHHQPMVVEVDPMLLRYKPKGIAVLQIRFAPGNQQQAEQDIHAAYASILPKKKPQLTLIDEKINEFYNIIFGDLIKIFGLFSGLAIAIASMGLLGMVTYTVQLKLKEVSIRKVHGATGPQLIMTLSKGFIILLAVGISIAIPVAYLLNDLWLQFLAVRVTMTFEVIAVGIGIILLFGALIIGSQTLRASLLNPVKFLKEE